MHYKIFSRLYNGRRYNEKGLYGHAVTVVGYGTDSDPNSITWVKKLLMQHNVSVHF